MILSKIVFSVEARHRVSPAGARRHRSFANAYSEDDFKILIYIIMYLREIATEN